MAWRPIERHLEVLREHLATDPMQVRHELDAIGKTHGLRPADCLRLLGLEVAANCKLGALARAESSVIAGMKIRTPSAVARADFFLQTGSLRLCQGRAQEALALIDRAGALMSTELEKPPPMAKESRRRRRWVEATCAAAHVLRGKVFYFHQSTGSLEEAFSEALTALQLTSNLVKASAHTRRVHLAAVTLLSALLMQAKSPVTIREALGVLEQAEQILIYRCRVPASHIHRIKLKWCRATALARLGRYERAEAMLADVVERLSTSGHLEDQDRALKALIWVVKQTRFPDRAAYMLKKYSSSAHGPDGADAPRRGR